MFERDVTRPICLVPFPLADECYTLCNVSDDGWLNFDRLGDNLNRHQHMREQSNTHRVGIGDRRVPFLQACSDKGSISASECTVG